MDDTRTDYANFLVSPSPFLSRLLIDFFLFPQRSEMINGAIPFRNFCALERVLVWSTRFEHFTVFKRKVNKGNRKIEFHFNEFAWARYVECNEYFRIYNEMIWLFISFFKKCTRVHFLFYHCKFIIVIHIYYYNTHVLFYLFIFVFHEMTEFYWIINDSFYFMKMKNDKIIFFNILIFIL